MDDKQKTPVDGLGTPLGLKEVSKLIGLSAWTVRQILVRDGLPHYRSSPSGKMIFYETQVVAWITNRQRKGGTMT